MSQSNESLNGSWEPTYLKALHYGSGTVDKHLISSLPSENSKAFIITGNSLASKTDLITKVEKLLGEHHAGTFSKIGAHAPVAQLDEGTDLVLKDDTIDTVISIGGGSPIDSAKALAHRVQEKTGKLLFHITIPTTLSAAECTAGAGYTQADGLKVGVKSNDIIPKIILYDSLFALKTPVQLFTSTGFRALDHAIETMYHPSASELARMLCLQATTKLFKYLTLYKASPTDEEIITELQLAAFASLGLFGYFPKTPLGLSHTLGYALGSPYGIPHGITSCLTLGHVIKLKARTDAQAARQLARVAKVIDLKGTGGNDVQDAEAVGDAVLELVKSMGLSTSLTERGVGEDQVEIIVKRALGGQDSGRVFDAVAELVRGLY